jgi:GNAT superfamily N-acetyltransferase
VDPSRPPGVIRACSAGDVPAMLAIVNDAAQAYRGVIPADCWHEPYMPEPALRGELARGVAFFGWEDGGSLRGVMGLQQVGDRALIRHAYVATAHRRRGIGAALLGHLRAEARAPMMVGTWAEATWAIAFYEKHGFVLNVPEEGWRLLRRYWNIPERQLETSVVLSDSHGFGDMLVGERSPR